MAQFQDVSTIGGALNRIWFRWKYTLLIILMIFGLLFAGTKILQNYDILGSGDIPESTFVQTGSKLAYHGNQLKFDSRYFDPFPDLPPLDNSQTSSSTPVDTIEIKWVRINGPNFTAQLQQYAATLKVIHLDNVTIEGHLQPVVLPNLQEFFLNQGAQPEETNSPDYILNHGPTPWLLSTLFFINDSSSDFATKAALAYTRPVNVTVFLKGSVAYQVNPGFNEVRLDISTCSDILRKLPQTFTILTLGRCNDLTPTSIHPRVTFLSLYIVYVTSDLLSAILRNIKDLEEFYAEIPDGQVGINLQNLPPKMRILSVSSMNIIPGTGSYPNIKEFYFGAENQYGWLENRVTTLNETIFLNFASIFPQVEKVGLFDLKDEKRYIFLRSVLQSPTVRWILVENFGKQANATDVGINVNAYLFVENQLDQLGLSKDTLDFVVEIDNSTGSETRVAKEITHLKKLWYRFTYLGWCAIDSWPKFLYVQGIIDDGGLLGVRDKPV